MKNKKAIIITSVVICLAIAIGIVAYAVSTAGTSSDPLITKSYVDNVLVPDIIDQAEDQINGASTELESNLDAVIDVIDVEGTTFKSVTLASGEKMVCGEGTEIMLRSGTATADSENLVDITVSAAVTSGGSLTVNHMCVSSADGTAITASSSVQLLVRGDYTIS